MSFLRSYTSARASSAFRRSAFAVLSLSISAPHAVRIFSSSLAATAATHGAGSRRGSTTGSEPIAYADTRHPISSRTTSKPLRIDRPDLADESNNIRRYSSHHGGFAGDM